MSLLKPPDRPGGQAVPARAAGPSGVPNYPGAYSGVIAVASTRPDDSISPDSTNGDFVDVAAPGNPILSTWDSRLDATVPQDLQPTHGIGYKVLAGTSMASPIAAGLAALMKTVRPDLTPDEVQLLMEAGSDDVGAVGPRPRVRGRPDQRPPRPPGGAGLRPPGGAAAGGSGPQEGEDLLQLHRRRPEGQGRQAGPPRRAHGRQARMQGAHGAGATEGPAQIPARRTARVRGSAA